MRNITRQATIAATLFALAFGTSIAVAQYVGPSSMPNYKSVAEVLKDPIDDTPITLEGFIVRQVSKNKYMFSDGASEIRIEIDHKRFPAAQPISEKTKVRISGEVEKDMMRNPKIEVDRLTVIE